MLASLPHSVAEALVESGLSSPATLINHIRIAPWNPPRATAADSPSSAGHATFASTTAASTAAKTASTTCRLGARTPGPTISCSDVLQSVISDEVLQQTGLSRDDIFALLLNFVQGLTARVVTSGACIVHLPRSEAYVSTGCASLDQILGGGFRRGELIEICGKSGSGKTQLAMSTMTSVVSKHNPTETAVMIDTSHSFCPFRCSELLQSDRNVKCHGRGKTFQTTPVKMAGALSTCTTGESATMDDRMARLSIVGAYNIYDLYNALEIIADSISADNCAARPAVLVIDCIATFIAPNLCKGWMGQASIEALGKTLRQIARDFGIAVIVTNNAVSNRDANNREWKPALGKVWGFVPDRRLQLHLHNSSSFSATKKMEPDAAVGTMASDKNYMQPMQSTAQTLNCQIGVDTNGIYLL